jgi:hypothetical protein
MAQYRPDHRAYAGPLGEPPRQDTGAAADLEYPGVRLKFDQLEERTPHRPLLCLRAAGLKYLGETLLGCGI